MNSCVHLQMNTLFWCWILRWVHRKALFFLLINLPYGLHSSGGCYFLFYMEFSIKKNLWSQLKKNFSCSLPLLHSLLNWGNFWKWFAIFLQPSSTLRASVMLIFQELGSCSGKLTPADCWDKDWEGFEDIWDLGFSKLLHSSYVLFFLSKAKHFSTFFCYMYI